MVSPDAAAPSADTRLLHGTVRLQVLPVPFAATYLVSAWPGEVVRRAPSTARDAMKSWCKYGSPI